ncbi:hypothetical protein MRX96_046492 [Rhipicephalus microplus]
MDVASVGGCAAFYSSPRTSSARRSEVIAGRWIAALAVNPGSMKAFLRRGVMVVASETISIFGENNWTSHPLFPTPRTIREHHVPLDSASSGGGPVVDGGSGQPATAAIAMPSPVTRERLMGRELDLLLLSLRSLRSPYCSCAILCSRAPQTWYEDEAHLFSRPLLRCAVTAKH